MEMLMLTTRGVPLAYVLLEQHDIRISKRCLPSNIGLGIELYSDAFLSNLLLYRHMPREEKIVRI